MDTIRTIAEYIAPAKTIKEDDWDAAWEAMNEERNAKNHAAAVIDDNVYSAIGTLIKSVIAGDDNAVFSPTALYMALIVLGEITANDTKQQILDIVGITEKESREIYKAVKDLTESLCGYANSTVSSSMWFNDSLVYNEELLDKLKRFYQVSSYAGAMGTDDMNKAIASWVNTATGNMLAENMKIETSSDMLLDFFTTIYFCSKWDHEFWDDGIKSGKFYLENGENVKCKMMHQYIQTQYHEGRKFVAMTKELNGGYDAIFVLPNEGVTINELVDDEQVMELATRCRIAGTDTCDVTFAMPEFDISSKIDLIGHMKKLGIKDAFIPGQADFSAVSNEDELYLSKAEQTTRIKMDKEGVEAASCVEMGVCCAGIPPEYRKVELTLDRPFLFFITSHGAMPIIAGKLMNPTE